MFLFVTGLVGGLAIAAPVGPIGMLCIHRSVAHGRLVGFACGLGAATADALYGAIAAFGFTAISQALVANQLWIQLVGGLALVAIGAAAFRARPAARRAAGEPRGLGAAYLSTLALTLMNPMTILSFLAIFAGLGLGAEAGSITGAMLLVLGVFVGSVGWWLVVSLAGGWLGSRLEQSGLRVMNLVAGTIITLLGAWQLAAFVRNFLTR
ncbi:LysE family transporter [Opitutus sp. ER46]|uniref:LysE family translocator n=1 Tax=Opitutus sp. ER46 TaxID=2161864 RepID=UPI000D30C678|nr:LysE family transporter [Opitutus sp. ER46]PTX92556.1 lysine transporter LysE [Opitutus sp. ER46]